MGCDALLQGIFPTQGSNLSLTSPALAGGFLTTTASREALKPAAAAAAELLQACPTLCDPVDGSPPGSPTPESLQAGTLEWVAISFCKKPVYMPEF